MNTWDGVDTDRAPTGAWPSLAFQARRSRLRTRLCWLLLILCWHCSCIFLAKWPGTDNSNSSFIEPRADHDPCYRLSHRDRNRGGKSGNNVLQLGSTRRLVDSDGRTRFCRHERLRLPLLLTLRTSFFAYGLSRSLSGKYREPARNIFGPIRCGPSLISSSAASRTRGVGETARPISNNLERSI